MVAMPPSATHAPQAVPAVHPVRVRQLEVLRRESLTPRMVRLVLGGPGLAGFESHVPDEHVKLVFPDRDGGTRPPVEVLDGAALEWPRPFPPNREYTIRRYDRDSHEVWIDFVVHAGGLASDWAQQVEPGDAVWVAGPRPGLVVPPEFGHQVLLADHTALPAVGRWLEELPAGVEVQAVVAVPDAGEQQELAVRPGVEVIWLHTEDPAYDEASLGQALERMTLPVDRPVYLWAAGEAGVLKPVRRWARANGFARGTCDISGYWRAPRTSRSTLP